MFRLRNKSVRQGAVGLRDQANADEKKRDAEEHDENDYKNDEKPNCFRHVPYLLLIVLIACAAICNKSL
jgi:hypothetical protein